jgi:hypothetical protein
VIPGFSHDIDDICALMICYAAWSVNHFADVSEQNIGPIFKDQEFQ